MDGLVHAAARCMDNGIKNKYKIRKEKLNYGTEYGWIRPEAGGTLC